MARTTKPLTNTEVSQAKPKSKEYNLSDGQGLMLRVKPNGGKQWIFNYYRPFNNKRANISLGTFPEITLAEARAKRAEARELLAKKIDPKEDRDKKAQLEAEANSNTFKYIAMRFYEIKKTSLNPTNAKKVWRSIELHLFPELGDIPISRLEAPKVINTLRPLADKSLETVKRLCQRINEIMIYAVNTGIITSNPLAGISKAFSAPAKKHYPTIPPSELPEFMTALSRANIKLTTRCLIEWQLHTMVRPSEAAGTRWDEINLEAGLWTIPAERMKKQRVHIVPLTPQALALLEFIKPISSRSDYVFPSDRNYRKPACKSSANMAIKRMGYHGKLVSHGLRSIASTALNEQGFDYDVIESCLAHVDKDEVRAAYNRTDYLERRKKIMSWWSDFIEKCAAGSMSLSSGRKGLQVVNM
jgi:integrase